MLKGTSTTSVFLDSLSQRMPAGNFLVSVAFPLFHFLHVFLLGHTFAPQWRGSRGRPLPVAGGGSPKLREIRSATTERSEGKCTTIFRGGQFKSLHLRRRACEKMRNHFSYAPSFCSGWFVYNCNRKKGHSSPYPIFFNI